MGQAADILKLYELRTEPEMRSARKWFFNDFDPKKATDILYLYKSGERSSANFRMVVSYWDMASSLVASGLIDEKAFLLANTEHIFVYAKIRKYLPEIRKVFEEPDFLKSLEDLCINMPDFEKKLETRTKLAAIWTHADGAEAANL
ncbi:MAG: hypothetical protein R2684_10350 [Pyrinomonadaceae bacterium]